MKNRSIVSLLSGAIALLILGGYATQQRAAAVYQDSDEITETFTLPRKAHVDVFAINGSVDINAIDGDTATIEIKRTGRSRAELECNKIVFRQAAGKLLIASENQDCGTIQVKHRVQLSLPRTVDLSVHGVSGPVNIGEIEGALRLSGNSGTTTIKLRQLNRRGLELSGNSGATRLLVADDLNIDVRVSGLSGSVSSELPNVKFRKTGAADYYARVGSGGPTINIDGSSGSVSLIPYRE